MWNKFKIEIICFIILAIIFGMSFYNTDAYKTDIENVLKAPGHKYIFGTDGLGRDIYSRVLIASRITIILALKASFIAMFIGLLIVFILTRHKNGLKLIELLSKIYDLLPFNMIILTLLLLFTNYSSFHIIAGFVFSLIVIKKINNNIKEDIDKKYYYLIPKYFINTFFYICGIFVLTEISMGYLGFSIQQPDPGFGNLLVNAKENILNAPWILYFPSIFAIIIPMLFFIIDKKINDKETNQRLPDYF